MDHNISIPHGIYKLLLLAPKKWVEGMFEVCHTPVALDADLNAMGLDSCKTVSPPDSEKALMALDTNPSVSTPDTETMQINDIMIAAITEAYMTITLPSSIGSSKY